MLGDQKIEKNEESLHHRIPSKTEMERDWTYSQNEREQMGRAVLRMATQEREKIQRTTMQEKTG